MIPAIVAVLLALACGYAAWRNRQISMFWMIVCIILTIAFAVAAVWIVKDVSIHSTTTVNQG